MLGRLLYQHLQEFLLILNYAIFLLLMCSQEHFFCNLEKSRVEGVGRGEKGEGGGRGDKVNITGRSAVSSHELFHCTCQRLFYRCEQSLVLKGHPDWDLLTANRLTREPLK